MVSPSPALTLTAPSFPITHLDGRVSLDSKPGGQLRVRRGIDLAQFDVALELTGRLGPLRLQALAVAARGGKREQEGARRLIPGSAANG